MKKLAILAIVAMLALPALAFAAEGAPPAGGAAAPPTQSNWSIPPRGLMALGITVGLGLIIIGAGKGIGSIGSHATDAIARQPEAGGRIFTTMIISAALIEGVTLFAIVVALLTMIMGNV